MTTEEFIDVFPDPVVVLDDGGFSAVNEPARELFGLEDVSGRPLSAIFAETPSLAERYADAMTYYPDVGGAIEGADRHFDREHPTIAAVLDGRDPEDADPDVGMFADGDLRYFHVTTTSLEDVPGHGDRLLSFRDVTAIKRRERDLDFVMQVTSRVLRHNLRNDLTVAEGYATVIEEQAEGREAEMAAEIRHVCAQLVETSSKARRVQAAVDANGCVSFDLQDLLEDVADRVVSEHPDAELAIDVPALWVRANPELPHALEDVLENAVVHNDAPTPRVEIEARRDGPRVVTSVTDDGPGIPEEELEIFVRRGETDLVHGSGVGLWLIQTVVEESEGEVTFDADGDGTTVRLVLPAAES